jgi:CheY-like chemotaxis protein
VVLYASRIVYILASGRRFVKAYEMLVITHEIYAPLTPGEEPARCSFSLSFQPNRGLLFSAADRIGAQYDTIKIIMGMTTRGLHNTAAPGDYVLVVDSNENEAYILAALLQRFRYRVTTARNAARALESMAASMPALIVTMQSLPDMGGPDLIRRFTKASGAATVPVIVLDEANAVGEEKRVLDAGAAAYFTKPVPVEDLYRAVQAAMETTPRENIRVNTNLPLSIDGVRLDYEGGEHVSMISEQGMHVKMRNLHDLKRQFSVMIKIHDRVISLIAEVVYRKEPSSTPPPELGIGLKFVRIAPEDRQYIKHYVETEVTKGISYDKRKDILEQTGNHSL